MASTTTQWVYAIATLDTKRKEIEYVARCLHDAGVPVKIIDVSTHETNGSSDAIRLSEHIPDYKPADLKTLDRGVAINLMSQALRRFLTHEASLNSVAAVLGIGGSGGTAIATYAMRALDIGIPKLMVSTMASGQTAPYVDCNDITMMYSVVDIAGLNTVSRKVLGNAAHAVAGMVKHKVEPASLKKTVGLTMFGVTTTGVTQIRHCLESQGHECLVFHATGTGGRAMERLVESKLIQGVIDFTTTEVADEVVGGVFPCGSERFDRILAADIPYVLSLGALDMVNFGGLDTVPRQFRNRKLHVHNAQVTLMRTNEQENVRIGRWIANKLNQSNAAWTLLIPLHGLSALDVEDGVFYDPVANTALIETLKSHLQTNQRGRILEIPNHINDADFAQAVVREYDALANSCPQKL